MNETTQLMLTVECAAECEASLAAVLQQTLIACAIIVPPGWQPSLTAPNESETTLPPLDAEISKRLVKLIQTHEVAALIANSADLAQATSADGCHFDHNEDLLTTFETTRRDLGPEASLGVMPGTTRHQAMSLAEAGADYMGYPVTTDPDDEGSALMAWWAEIFETPVVAFIDGSSEAAKHALLAGPPDFLAVPVNPTSALSQFSDLAALIQQHGQLPTA